jgi:hypothetical protein
MRLRAPVAVLFALAITVLPTAHVSAAATITLDQPAPVTLGEYVTFTTTGIPNHIKNPRIEVLCDRAGALVYGEAGGIADAFLLGGGGSIWLDTGGPADCTANLFYFDNSGPSQTYVQLASTTFGAA